MASSEEIAAGPAIVRTIELAASLAMLTARVAGRADLAERARALGREARPLAEADAAAYSDFLRTRSEEDRGRTIELPVQMADLAAQTAEVAAEAAAAAEGAVGGDPGAGTRRAGAPARAGGGLGRMTGGGHAAQGSSARAARAAARV